MKISTIQLGSPHDVAIHLDRWRVIPLYPVGSKLQVQQEDSGEMQYVRVVGFDVARATLDVLPWKAEPSLEDLYYKAKVAERKDITHRLWFGS